MKTTIEHKYGIGSKVFFIDEKIIREGVVEKIIINSDGFIVYEICYTKHEGFMLSNDNIIEFTENCVYSSEKEAIEELIYVYSDALDNLKIRLESI